MNAIQLHALIHEERETLAFDGLTMWLDEGENDVILMNAGACYFHPYCNWARPV